MDELVLQAMAKWPHVPDCHGWLGLDARGQWYLRDAAVQEQGRFPQSKGSRLEHAKLVAFIGRNYACDPAGCWYFQNGPQRVFVELEATPWIFRVQADGGVQTHTGLAATVQACLVDESGKAYLVTERGLGLVHSLDTITLEQHLAQERWHLHEVLSHELPQRYGYVASPLAQQLTAQAPALGAR